ncbi:MAG: enoyl-CoA hydratase/isomerase family protein [Streptomyces sp.]|uniref:2-cyclohexenylcarbonyl CoA isomerase n=1 Tax=Streptomyces sp. TaxID=1931 RepID=UPI0025EDB220|nr:enoyl-CoA hydratase-related protein [Streptomyces sp.]MBW8798740.1 enoyl-CoA hydratase/isomerase family protein [Streptomyces sp.]
MTDTVLYEVGDGLATITLNRPEAMNALNIATKVALREAAQEAAADTAVRAILLTAAGDRAFCVGQDLKEHITLLASDRETGAGQTMTTVREHYNPIVRALVSAPKPVVAAVNGVAAGAGLGFALAADYRVVADTAAFNTSFAAQDAYELGIANKVVPSAELRAEAEKVARKLAEGPTVAYAALKEAVAYGLTHSLDETLDKEDELQARAGASEDHGIAVQAFVNKEKPKYLGR